MSCEAGFTDSRCNEQTTDNPRAKAGATLAIALSDFAEDIERARDLLVIAIERAASRPDYFIDDLEDAEDAEDDADSVTVEKCAIADLREAYDDVTGAITHAFASFDWEVARALRAFKQAITRQSAP